MSQSSTSSLKSMESRKRSRTSSEPESIRKSQRTRSALTLKRKYLEISSQSSSESARCDDVQSTGSCSVVTGAPLETSSNTLKHARGAPLETNLSILRCSTGTPSETNSSNFGHSLLATQHGISIESARKYHDILIKTYEVPVIRIASIKIEPVTPEEILHVSPTFGSKKRGRRRKIKIEPKSDENHKQRRDFLPEKLLSTRACQNIRDYFKTLDNVRIKQEPKLDNLAQESEIPEIYEESKNQDLIQNGSKSQFKSKSFSQVDNEMHDQNFDQSTNKIKRFSKSYNCLPESSTFSHNDSQVSSRSTRSSSRKSNEKLHGSNVTITKTRSSNKWNKIIQYDTESSGDDFEVSRSKKKSSSNSSSKITKENNETLVTNPFSNIHKKLQTSQKLKRKKSFWKKKFGSDDPVKRKKKFVETFMINEGDKKDELLNCTLEIENEKKDLEEKIETGCNRINAEYHKTTQENCNDVELISIDSLSVNCQYFNKPNIIETAASISNKSGSSSPLLSFGADPSDCKQNTPNNEIICDLDVNSPQDIHEVLNNGDNLQDQENNLNDSFLSLDLEESLTKYEDTESNVELENKKISIHQPKMIKTVQKPRAKPKIINDSKLPNNSIVISNPKSTGVRKLKLKNNSKVALSNSNQLQHASIQLPLEKSNGIDKRTNGSSPSPELTLNGITKTFISNHDVNQQKQLANNLKNNDIEESFDSICQDITLLTNNNELTENVTLYSGNNLNDADIEVLSSSTVNNSIKQRFKPSKCELLSSVMEEKSTSGFNMSTLKKSPITFKRTSRLSLSLKPPTILKTQESTNPSDTKEKFLSSLNTSTTAKSPINLQGNSQLSLSLKSSTAARIRSNTASNNINKTYLPSLSNSTGRKSPITFQSTPRLSSCLGSPTTIQKNMISSKLKCGLEQNLSQSENSLNKTQQQQTTSQSLSSFPTYASFINNDPRLNKSLSPVKTSNLNSRDPRLNRSISPVKSSLLTDSRLVNSSTRPKSPTSMNHIDESPDPRLRKRKERENNEKTIQQKREMNFDVQENDSSTATKDLTTASQQTLKKSSVFERLGKRKSPSPKKSVDTSNKELMDIIKGAKSRPINYYDTDDDDNVSLHPGNMFSSDEESASSPPRSRHCKFISERDCISEEIRNKPISVKDRLTWKTSDTNQRRLTSFSTAASSMTVPTTTTVKTTKVINRITFGTNTSDQSRSVKVTAPIIQPSMQISGMEAYALQCRQTAFNTYSNNDSAFNEQFYKTHSAALNDKFFKMNTAQMLKDVDNLTQNGSTPNVTFDNNNTQQQTSTTNFFRSLCYRALRTGNCLVEMSSCKYSHNMYTLQQLITKKNIDLLLPILDLAIRQKYAFFLQNVWNSILPTLKLEALNIYHKLYRAQLRNERFLNELLDYCVNTKLHTVESFVKQLALYVEPGNKEWVRVICVAIKAKMSDGFCWETIKCLSQKAVPPVDMIELAILQCLKRKKNSSHISEVYDLVENRMNNLEKNRMSQSMLKQFYSLVQKLGLMDSKQVLSTVPIANSTNVVTEHSISPLTSNCRSGESLRLSEMENQNAIVNISPAIRRNKVTSPLTTLQSYNVQQPDHSPLDVGMRTPNTGESTNFTEYVVKEVESNEPSSAFRDKFWKLYLAVNNVNQGLDHEDYDYVWKTLRKFNKEKVEDSLLKRTYYHILCKKVKSSEQYLSEIIKRAVHNRATPQKCLDLLFEVGMCALIDLANSELWVLALHLLNSIKIIEPNEPRTDFVLICTEIYLANNDPNEALNLLKRTGLIRTNRDQWLTKDHTKNHEKHRNKVVIILLRALSYVDPNAAVYLFQELLKDQYIDYYPIDLRLYLDNLILLLLTHNEEELVADVCRLIMKSDLTFQKATYRELMSRMLAVDEVLTNQILDYAINLGYYNDIKINNGFITVIIDTNSTEEELYLILTRLIHMYVLHIGPGIDHLKPNQLKAFIIFEDIPVIKRLYRNETLVKGKDAYINIRNQVNNMLGTRFTPAIRISRGKISKVCKIMSRTLVDHLKHRYCKM